MGDSELDKLLNSFIERGENGADILNKQVRFSITLPNLTSKRLDLVCKKLKLTKQQFISSVIEASLVDIEERLGLVSEAKKGPFGETQREYSGEYQAELFRELGWGHFIQSSESEDDDEE